MPYATTVQEPSKLSANFIVKSPVGGVARIDRAFDESTDWSKRQYNQFSNRRRVPERELFKSVATEQNKTRSLDCLETYINLKMIPKWSSLITLSARSIAFESAITKA